jgi:hypothetical protein
LLQAESNGRFHPKQYPAAEAGATACAASQISHSVEGVQVFRRFVERKLRKSRHARVKMPPHYCSTLVRSILAEWGLNLGEYSSWGVPSNDI